MGGTKAGALRGVPVADRLGLTSLVVSYRNDGQAPASTDGRHNLGQSEWRDVEAALAYAVDQGAKRIFLFGWSLGGSMALQAAARSEYRRQIVGLILDAPVFDWTSTLMANARAAKLPKPAAALGLRLLESKPLRKITGLHEPLELSALDWLPRAQELQTRMLVLHSENDRSTPFDVSRQIARIRPDLMTLIPFQNVEHTQEWNIDIERWDQAVFSWVAPRE
ncbi:alpha/beta fold hydrolase [Paenarthrobacter sp. PH39-S1]|uniref:alpha/beta hydrolase family protein n=1 Tax=Paenarthrobacter sp. PH39-S1 TaxID=3046204 RepID=UPI0032D8C241